MITRKGECCPKKQECLLSKDNFVANSKSASFEPRGLAWEASTHLTHYPGQFTPSPVLNSDQKTAKQALIILLSANTRFSLCFPQL